MHNADPKLSATETSVDYGVFVYKLLKI